MNATEPRPPAPDLQPQRSGAKRSSRGPTLAIALGALLAATYFLFGAVQPSESLSADQQQARNNAFQAVGAVELEPVPSAERQRAIADLQLPPDQAARLASDVASGAAKLVYITLWDDMAEDGDVVEVTSNGLARQVVITNAPTRIAMLAPPQGVVNLAGINDGGGGITIAAMSGSQRVALPYLVPGQRIGIPVKLP